MLQNLPNIGNSFLGGIVRLVAHDFMDFHIGDAANPMGSDGCIDMDHPDNSGLPQDVWCDTGCPLTDVYNNNFSHISKADFWIAAGERYDAIFCCKIHQCLDCIMWYISPITFHDNAMLQPMLSSGLPPITS